MQKKYLYLITSAHMINDSCQSVLPALLPLFILSYGLSLEEAGILIFANTALSSLLQPLLGYFSDKLSEPRLIALGTLLSACSTGMMGIVDSFPALIACSTMSGVGSAVFHPEAGKIVNRLSGNAKGKSMGTFAIGGSAGFAIGPVIAATIAYTIGPIGLMGFTIVGALMTILLFVLMPRIEAFARTLQQEVAASTKKAVEKVVTNDWKSFALLFLVIVAQSINFRVVNAFIPVFWIKELGQTPEAGSFALTVFFSIGIVMTYVGGIWADRIGPNRLIRYTMLLWLPATIIFPQSTTLWMAYLAISIIGVAKALTYSPMVVLGQTYLAKSVGFASGITFGLSMTIGGMVAPLVGKLADMYDLPTALLVLTPCMLLGVIGSYLLPIPKKEEQ